MTMTPDSEVEKLSEQYESSIKNLKHNVYRLGWYMRGGVDAYKLFYDTDVEDLDILGKIVEENIETSKKAKTPIL